MFDKPTARSAPALFFVLRQPVCRGTIFSVWTEKGNAYHADFRNRPGLRHRGLRPGGGRPRPAAAGAVRRHHHPGGGASARPPAPDLRRHGPAAEAVQAPGHGGGGAVLQQQHHHGHRRGPGQGRDPALRRAPQGAHLRIHPQSGEAGGGGLRQGGEAAGHGHDPPPAEPEGADAVAIALCHARSCTSRLQSPDAAKPGSGRYEVRHPTR